MDDLYQGTDIIELKYKDFKIKNKNKKIHNKNFMNKKGLIILYAPWCKHCNDITSYMVELGSFYKNIFPIGAINSEDILYKNDKLLKYFNYKYYPTLFTISKKGNINLYKNQLSKDELHYYIGSQL